MSNLLGNNWIIGIGGGLISTILYSSISFIIKKISKINDIKKANNEILSLLKPYVIDRGFPEIEIVKSLIEATARKYKISSKQMFSIPDICEELMKEITESIYITYEKKNEYNKDLTNYKKIIEEKNAFSLEVETFKNINEKSYFFDKFVPLISMATTAMFSVFLLLITLEKYPTEKAFYTDEKEKLFFISLLFILIALLLLVVLLFRRVIKRGNND